MNTKNFLLFIFSLFALSTFSKDTDLSIITNYLENNIQKFSFNSKDINDIIIKDKSASKNNFKEY